MAVTSKDRSVEVGRRLAAARLQRGLSQATVARLVGIAPSYLSRIETGRVHPTMRTAVRLASSLKISLDDLSGPTSPGHRGRPCPVSRGGHCFLDVLRAETTAPVASGQVTYTPRQLRLIRRFTALLENSTPEVLRALEVLFGEILATGSGTDPQGTTPED